MKSVWTKGLTAEEKKRRETEFKQAEEILKVLTEILNKKELDALRAAKPDHMDAGWPFKAADANGYMRAVQEIKSIIEVTP